MNNERVFNLALYARLWHIYLLRLLSKIFYTSARLFSKKPFHSFCQQWCLQYKAVCGIYLLLEYCMKILKEC
jgi:hypothetical protein